MDIIGESFTSYGLGHRLMLILTAVGIVALIPFGRRLRGSVAETRISRAFGVALLTISTINLAIGLWPANFVLALSLPLHFSDALRFIAGYALLTRRPWAVAITYYWGLTLNPQALLTPTLTYNLAPWYDFTVYWAQHIGVMWAAVWLTWGLGLSPTWRDYRRSMIITVGWAALAFTVNVVARTDYGFLNGKPSGGSALDLLGPWPWYLASEAAAMIIIWALITWPWAVLSRRGTPASPP
ncbi:YwaF family protein [Microlunatus soli]|uniref:YwaF family protein n=1 Tax=Microlunatus soli TaxID=630515 RepID=UPI0018D2A1F3|nr:TIGR02206 family membrane protein [Microlunatus soli]